MSGDKNKVPPRDGKPSTTTEEYWTDERRRKAKPMPMTVSDEELAELKDRRKKSKE